MRRADDCELMTLTFDFGGHRDCRSYFVRVPSANYADTTTIRRFRFMGHWANTAQTDHVTLRPVADAGRRPSSVYQVLSS